MMPRCQKGAIDIELYGTENMLLNKKYNGAHMSGYDSVDNWVEIDEPQTDEATPEQLEAALQQIGGDLK